MGGRLEDATRRSGAGWEEGARGGGCVADTLGQLTSWVERVSRLAPLPNAMEVSRMSSWRVVDSLVCKVCRARKRDRTLN